MYLSMVQELYRAAYGEPLVADGTMFRGSPPPFWAVVPDIGACAASTYPPLPTPPGLHQTTPQLGRLASELCFLAALGHTEVTQ